jgi:hypothetical protein
MAENPPACKLSAKERDTINKMPTARVIHKLAAIGFTDEQLELMEREELLRAWISAVTEGRDKTPVSQPPVTASDCTMSQALSLCG